MEEVNMFSKNQVDCHSAVNRIQSPGLALVFSDVEIEDARKNGRLLSLDIELTKLCNFRCEYCYAAPGKRRENELTRREAIRLIDDAIVLGLRTLTLTGGEPLMDDKYFPLAEYASKRGITVLLFTNGAFITRKIAEKLMALKVAPCVKLDSLSASVQDEMAGVVGAYDRIQKGLGHLISAGFTSDYPVLAINATVCRKNIDGIPALWKWAREHDISPSITRLQPMGRATGKEDLSVAASELQLLYHRLSKIDQTFGIHWEPNMPWHTGKACRRHDIGGFVDSQGNVQPCSGVPLPAGNIRETKIGDILSSTEIFKTARDIRKNLKGKCGSCKNNDKCYGCRSISYFSGNGFTGSDDLCWVE